MKFRALHTCIYTDNDKESIKFYEDALNMHITSRKDFEKAYERHQEMGVVIQKIGGLSDGSAKFYFIKDPQGFSIEIIEELSRG